MKTGFSTKSTNLKHKKIKKFEKSKKNKKIILEIKGTWFVVENSWKTGSAENLTNGLRQGGDQKQENLHNALIHLYLVDSYCNSVSTHLVKDFIK
jgi:hypothetical protein